MKNILKSIMKYLGEAVYTVRHPILSWKAHEIKKEDKKKLFNDEEFEFIMDSNDDEIELDNFDEYEKDKKNKKGKQSKKEKNKIFSDFEIEEITKSKQQRKDSDNEIEIEEINMDSVMDKTEENVLNVVMNYLVNSRLDCYQSLKVRNLVDEVEELGKGKELVEFIKNSGTVRVDIRYRIVVEEMDKLIKGIENVDEQNFVIVEPEVDEKETIETKQIDPISELNACKKAYEDGKISTGEYKSKLNSIKKTANSLKADAVKLHPESLMVPYSKVEKAKEEKQEKVITNVIKELPYVALCGISMSKLNELLNKEKLSDCDLQILKSELISLKNRFAYANAESISENYKTIMVAIEEKVNLQNKIELGHVSLQSINMGTFTKLLNKSKLNDSELITLKNELVSIKKRYNSETSKAIKENCKIVADAIERKLTM